MAPVTPRTLLWLARALPALRARPAGWSRRYTLLSRGYRFALEEALRRPPAARRAFLERVAPPSAPSPWVRARPSTDPPGLWLEPRARVGKARADRVLLYLHGGGYQVGSPRTYADFVGRLVRRTRLRAFVLDYRLTPAHPYPAAVDDAEAAYVALRRAHPGVEVVVAGDSAGGNLTAALVQRLAFRGLPLPARLGLVSPWVDLSNTYPSRPEDLTTDVLPDGIAAAWGGAYATEEEWLDPMVSPVFADLSGFPPMLVQAGGAEQLQMAIVAFAERARAAGVATDLRVWPGMVHDWHLFAPFGVPESRAAIAELADFLAA